MSRPENVSKDIVSLLEENRTGTIKTLDNFKKMLIEFRYEGKPSFGKNIKKAKDMLKFFNQESLQHYELEENILFPFVRSHLPKLELMIHMLEAEHQDFEKNVNQFSLLVNQASKKNVDNYYGEWLRQISDTGTYLIYLLKHHLNTRKKCVDRVIERELRDDEKKELGNRVSRLALTATSGAYYW